MLRDFRGFGTQPMRASPARKSAQTRSTADSNDAASGGAVCAGVKVRVTSKSAVFKAIMRAELFGAQVREHVC